MIGDEAETGFPQAAGAGFRTTHWSVALAARVDDSPQAADALAQLCGTYWYPLYAHFTPPQNEESPDCIGLQ